MSEHIQAWVNYLMQVDNTILAVAVVRNDGTVVYSTTNWTINGAEIVNIVQSKSPSVVIQGVKYSTIQATEHHLVATNIRGQGSIAISAARDKGFVVAYISPQGDVQLAYVEVSKASANIGGFM
jgi:predicted regulator of Ras-like GTPase activity (Roadblock/LC7/MglB family)